jgi:hypothetical protein|eukprot:1212791-Prymnesium_polylepis.1
MDCDSDDTVCLEWCGSKLALADACGNSGVRWQTVPGLRWHLVRAAMMRARPIAVFWLKVVAEKQYAASGAGRKRDLEAFEADNS